MARRRIDAEETARLEIVCNDAHECSVKFTGDKVAMMAAFAGLLEDQSEDNVVHDFIEAAISLVGMMKKERKKE